MSAANADSTFYAQAIASGHQSALSQEKAEYLRQLRQGQSNGPSPPSSQQQHPPASSYYNEPPQQNGYASPPQPRSRGQLLLLPLIVPLPLPLLRTGTKQRQKKKQKRQLDVEPKKNKRDRNSLKLKARLRLRLPRQSLVSTTREISHLLLRTQFLDPQLVMHLRDRLRKRRKNFQPIIVRNKLSTTVELKQSHLLLQLANRFSKRTRAVSRLRTLTRMATINLLHQPRRCRILLTHRLHQLPLHRIILETRKSRSVSNEPNLPICRRRQEVPIPDRYFVTTLSHLRLHLYLRRMGITLLQEDMTDEERRAMEPESKDSEVSI